MILKSVFGGSAQNPRANMSGGGFSLKGGQDCSGQSPSQCQWAGKGFTMVTISLSHDSTMLSWSLQRLRMKQNLIIFLN